MRCWRRASSDSGFFSVDLFFAEAVTTAFHASGLYGEDKVIIVLAIEVRHETLLAPAKPWFINRRHSWSVSIPFTIVFNHFLSVKFGLYWSLFNTSCMGCLQSIKFRIQPALAKSKTSVSRYLQHAAAAGYKPAPQLGRYLQFITQNLYTFSKALFYLSCFIFLYK